jgi:RimJ/RimL family protein N-acetyltransferase
MIHGKSISLRPANLEDFDVWRALRESSADYLSARESDWSDEVISFESFKRQVEDGAAAIKAGVGLPLLIFRNDGAMVGGITLGPIEAKAAPIGTWIASEFVNRGYAYRAVELIVALAFEKLGVDRIEAVVLDDNIGSVRVVEALGFEQIDDRVVTRKISGVPREHLVFVRMRPLDEVLRL